MFRHHLPTWRLRWTVGRLSVRLVLLSYSIPGNSLAGPGSRTAYAYEGARLKAWRGRASTLARPASTSRLVLAASTPSSSTAGGTYEYSTMRLLFPYSSSCHSTCTCCGCGTALSFDPERFIDERVWKYLVLNPFIFLPFNAGPRICLGQQVRRPISPHNAPRPSVAPALASRVHVVCSHAFPLLAVRIQRYLVHACPPPAALRVHRPQPGRAPGVEWNPYAVDGCERVWMRCQSTTYANVRFQFVVMVGGWEDADSRGTCFSMGCG